MKVLFLTDGLACGGKERQLVELATGLVGAGRLGREDVAVVSMSARGHYDQQLEKEGISIHRIIRHLRWDPSVPFKLGELLRDFRPNILHSFNLMTTIYAGFTCKPPGCKLIDGCIRNAFPLQNLKEKILHRLSFFMADVVCANSKAGLEAKQAPTRKSTVLYNGFDFCRVEHLRSSKEVRDELGLTTGPVVGMVARFSRFKDWDTFFEAARLVRILRPDVTFVAVGDGELFEQYRSKYANDAGIVFPGERNDVEDIQQVFNIGVLCSYIEGFPNAVLEYMGLEKPVVVTDGGGVRELVVNGETGFVVPPQDPRALVDKLIDLLTHPDDAKAMGEAGRRRIQEHFSMDYTLETLCAMYEGAITGQELTPRKDLHVPH